MKAEILKSLLDCYLQEQKDSDEIDGSHKNGDCAHITEAESSCEAVENDGLSPEQEIFIRHIARQMNKCALIFEKTKGGQHFEKIGNILQFKESSLFVPLKESKAVIAIVQNGDPVESTTKIKWKTMNGTAISGQNFIGSEGDLSFTKEDRQKLIEIQLINLKKAEGHFYVELFDANNMEEGPIDKLTIYIINNDLNSIEKKTVENILRPGRNVCLDNVISSLNDCVTTNTFQTALQYLCGSSDSIPIQLTFAGELTKFALRKIQKESLYNVVCNLFQNLPEMEEVVKHFH